MKYKICPRCGAHNSPNAFDCEKCDTDLTTVRVTDEETEKAEQSESPAPKFVRICENCGFSNPANARKCTRCKEDISDIAITEEKEQQETQELHFRLTSVDGEYAFELHPGKTVIGREEEMADYLKNKVYVSRRHAELTLEDNKLTVLNLSHSNYTFVNDERCVAEKVELHDGDELGLGGKKINGERQDDAAYFMVRIGTCS